MTITVNILYSGKDQAARDFAQEMKTSGLLKKIRAEVGNLRYEYFQPLDDEHSLLLIDEWENQAAIDWHHKSEMMQAIAAMREKYHLKMKVTRFTKITE